MRDRNRSDSCVPDGEDVAVKAATVQMVSLTVGRALQPVVTGLFIFAPHGLVPCSVTTEAGSERKCCHEEGQNLRKFRVRGWLSDCHANTAYVW